MEEKEKLPNEREQIDVATRILRDVSRAIRNGGDFTSILDRWKKQNPGVPEIEEILRKIYSDELDFLITVLQRLPSLNISIERFKHSEQSLKSLNPSSQPLESTM
jgi:hypothetical protein